MSTYIDSEDIYSNYYSLQEFFAIIQKFVKKINNCKHMSQAKRIDFIDDSVVDLATAILDARPEYEESDKGEIPDNMIIRLLKKRIRSPLTNKPYTSLYYFVDDIETVLNKCLAYTNVISEMKTIGPGKTITYFDKTLKSQISRHPIITQKRQRLERRKHTRRKKDEDYIPLDSSTVRETTYIPMNSLVIPMNDPTNLNEVVILTTDMLCNDDNFIGWSGVNDIIDVTLKNIDVNIHFTEAKKGEINKLKNCISKINFINNEETEARLKLFLHILGKSKNKQS